VDAAGGARRSADLYHGVLSGFLAAGFEEVSRNGRSVRVRLEADAGRDGPAGAQPSTPK